MRWEPGKRSDNLEDRRGRQLRPSWGMGILGILILGLLTLLTGRNFLVLAPEVARNVPMRESTGPVQSTPQEEQQVEFVSFVLDDTQNTWRTLLGDTYRDAKLVVFRGSTPDGLRLRAGRDRAVLLPVDQKVYIDLGFFDELHQRFGAPGDFAQAYVLAHEIGHHVQHVLGIEPPVRARCSSAPTCATSSPSASSCRPTAWRASGATRPRSATSSSTATSRRGCTPPPRSATTASSARPRAGSRRTPSPTARRRSGSSGSAAGLESGDIERLRHLQGRMTERCATGAAYPAKAACRGSMPAASGGLAAAGARLEARDDRLHRRFRFRDFVAAMRFVNRMADVAEAEGHHPDFTRPLSRGGRRRSGPTPSAACRRTTSSWPPRSRHWPTGCVESRAARGGDRIRTGEWRFCRPLP